jgi:hypothetical protein
MNRITADGPLPENRPTTADPLNINARLYNQIGRLLDDLEAADRDDTCTFPQRLNALIAVGRIQVIFAALKKAEARESNNAGSAVRRYSAAFAKTYGARGRKASAGSDDDALIQLASTGRDDTGDDAA